MQYVINTTYGGFRVPEEVNNILNCGCYAFDYVGDIRTDPVLIDWVLNNKGNTALEVVTIPEDVTDWELEDYDGCERIIAVVEGRIVHI